MFFESFSQSKNTPIKLLIFVLIAVAAAYFRLGAITGTVIDIPIRADAHAYYNYALNLKFFNTYSSTPVEQGEPVPDAVRSPGYAVFLLPFVEYPPNDKMLLKINLIQAILGVLTVLVAWSIYLRLMPYGYALAAAGLTAISPHLVSFTTYMLTETLFTFLLVLSAWLIIVSREKQSLLLSLLAGACIAACALTRPTLNYFIFLFCIFLLIHHCNRKTLIFLLSMLMGFILIFSPWAVRNISTIGSISDTTLMVNTIHHGIYPGFMYEDVIESKGFPYRYDPRSREISQNFRSVLNEITERFQKAPVKHMKWYFFDKPRFLFSWSSLNGWGDIYIYPLIESPYFEKNTFIYSRALMHVLHWPLVIISLLACVLVWIPGVKCRVSETAVFISRLLALLILYFCLLHIIAAPFPRYSVPLRPVTYGMALYLLYLGSLCSRDIFNKANSLIRLRR